MMQREFTGRHMIGVMVAGFGIVVAVNMFMATQATSGFGGVIVENTYVASQKYNGWLEEARAQEALGWSAQLSHDADGYLTASTADVPEGAVVTALLRRPLGEEQRQTVRFAGSGDGAFRSTEVIDEGRWIVRLEIVADGENWAREFTLS